MLDQDDIHPLFDGAPDTTEFRKLRKRIVRLTREAIEAYGMARAGERWLVCLSGARTATRCWRR
jgi:tRNA 2-thiocytidine biosynthesis protein TtcA